MDLETFEKRFKEIIMHSSQVVLTKQGDKLPGQTKVEGYKQTSIFTGKPVTEIAFMQMVGGLNVIKDMCLSGNTYSQEEWKNALTENIVASAILYAICEDGKEATVKEAPNVESAK